MSPRPVSQGLRRRPSRSGPATIAALVLLAGATTVAWAAISRLVTGTWPAFTDAARDAVSPLAWDSPAVWAAAILLVLLGLALLLAAILPGRHTTARLVGPGGGDARSAEAVISRRGLARISAAHVDQTDGVDSSSIRASAKKVEVLVKTPLRDAGELPGDLRDSLARKLRSLGLEPVPKVVVRVRTSND